MRENDAWAGHGNLRWWEEGGLTSVHYMLGPWKEDKDSVSSAYGHGSKRWPCRSWAGFIASMFERKFPTGTGGACPPLLVSLPKIISSHSDGVGRTGLAWRRLIRIAGQVGVGACPYAIRDACALRCSKSRRWQEHAANGLRQRSGRDPDSRAAASRSGAPHTRSARATSAKLRALPDLLRVRGQRSLGTGPAQLTRSDVAAAQTSIRPARRPSLLARCRDCDACHLERIAADDCRQAFGRCCRQAKLNTM